MWILRSGFVAGLLVLVAAGALTSGACSIRPRIAHAESSPEALAQAVLDALEEGSVARLRDLALNEQEFREVVWPELPAARPERNLPFSYVWGDLRVKSEGSLTGTLERHGGRPLELVSIRFAGATQYESYVVHRDATLFVGGPDGRAQDVQLFGSVFEQGGRFKVFSYVVD